MATIRTPDRTLALRCKRASAQGKKITISFGTLSGWNRLTGMVQSVRALKSHRFKPLWEITIAEQK
jgi:hypothetical protein